ncbi:MAG: arsenical pump-driving ATPase [Gammaproteobacteria bacterium]|nr:arsenical pump-driving ATPase [Gammaproteobacteria bacterium]
MKFINIPPRFMFFTGKGGVGKTSIACATAVYLAENGKRVLLVSTDPASNIGQVFCTTIGNKITQLSNVKGLAALEIDPEAAAQVYRNRIVEPARGVLPEDVVRGMEEQLSGACTTEIAAFDEFTSLLTDPTLVHYYDHIVFDTAPTGHTIRLLQLPKAWSGFLDKGKGNASCLGPLAGLEKQHTQYKSAVDALADPARTRLILVARAETTTLREVAHTHVELANVGLTKQYLVVNGIFPEQEIADDRLARAIYDNEQSALANIPNALKSLPCDHIELKPFNLIGADALRQLFAIRVTRQQPLSSRPVTDEFPSKSEANKSAPILSTSYTLSNLVNEIAEGGRGLVMLMGKGGVGKTTMAAAIAVALAHRSLPVHLTTSDPAGDMCETLAEKIENLTVSNINPAIETERYRQHVLTTKGANLSQEERALLEEDLRSPCTEEIAVFSAFSRIIREAGKKFVVMDTAPTGHTLLLLDATGAYHKEIARQMGANKNFSTPMMRLQDPKQTKILIVTLAETTPILEAAHLQSELHRAGIKPWAWIVNNSLAAVTTTSPLLRNRATNELPKIDAITTKYASRYAIVPLLSETPVGAEHLLQLSSK